MLREGVTTISCRQFVALCSTAQPHVMHRDIRRLWVEIVQPVPLGTANASGPDQNHASTDCLHFARAEGKGCAHMNAADDEDIRELRHAASSARTRCIIVEA
jgi:hypothetical protein